MEGCTATILLGYCCSNYAFRHDFSPLCLLLFLVNDCFRKQHSAPPPPLQKAKKKALILEQELRELMGYLEVPSGFMVDSQASSGGLGENGGVAEKEAW